MDRAGCADGHFLTMIYAFAMTYGAYPGLVRLRDGAGCRPGGEGASVRDGTANARSEHAQWRTAACSSAR